MTKILGIGGVFFKSHDPDKLYAWYERYLGISNNDGSGVSFKVKNLMITLCVVYLNQTRTIFYRAIGNL